MIRGLCMAGLLILPLSVEGSASPAPLVWGAPGDSAGAPGHRRQASTAECSVETIDNMALLDGAMRLLWRVPESGPAESILVHAYHLTSGSAAAQVVANWTEAMPHDVVANPYPYGKLLAGAANVEATATIDPVTAEDLGPDAAAFAGGFHLTDSAGITSTVPFAMVAFHDGAMAYLLIVTAIPMEQDGAVSTPQVLTAESPLDRASALALEMMARTPGSAVSWAMPCEGGMFAVIPSPTDMTNAQVVFEEQYVSEYSE